MLAALTQNQQGHTFKALKPDFTVVAFKRIKIVISVSQIYRLPFSKHSAVVSQLWDVLCSYKLSFFSFFSQTNQEIIFFVLLSFLSPPFFYTPFSCASVKLLCHASIKAYAFRESTEVRRNLKNLTIQTTSASWTGSFWPSSCCTEIVPGSFYNKYINVWFGNWSVEKPSTPETLLYGRLYPNPTCARRVCGEEQQEHRDTHGWNTEKVTHWIHGVLKRKKGPKLS